MNKFLTQKEEIQILKQPGGPRCTSGWFPNELYKFRIDSFSLFYKLRKLVFEINEKVH